MDNLILSADFERCILGHTSSGESTSDVFEFITEHDEFLLLKEETKVQLLLKTNRMLKQDLSWMYKFGVHSKHLVALMDFVTDYTMTKLNVERN